MKLFSRFNASKPRAAAKKSGRSTKTGSGKLREPLLNNDQRLDVIGYVLLAGSVVTILSWASQQKGELTGTWIAILNSLFGWGALIAPALMGLLGLYLVVRRFGDRFPRPRVGRVMGLFVGYFAVLGLMHFMALVTQPDQSVKLPGGGEIGRLIAEMFSALIGNIGAVIALLVILLIAVMLIAATSMSQMIETARNAIAKMRTPLAERGQTITEDGVILPPWENEADVPINGLKRAKTKAAPAAASLSAKEGMIGVPVAPTPQRPSRSADGSLPPPRMIGQVSSPTLREGPGMGAASAPATTSARAEASSVPAAVSITSRYDGKQDWQLPTLEKMLEPGSDAELKESDMRAKSKVIEETLRSFGVPARVIEINCGPTITQYGVEPGFTEMKNGKQQKVKVSRIAALADDLTLALSAPRIRIEAPVPGKGIVGIEVPNGATSVVSLRDVMESEAFGKIEKKTRLPLALGQDVSGGPVVADLTVMPHMLIAGTTGSGKSVCVNGIINTLLMLNSPLDLRMIMVDPKRVELTGYNGLPHLLAPVVVDVEKVGGVLHWVTKEMDNRYRTFAKFGSRNIVDFNAKAVEAEAKRANAAANGAVASETELKKLPYIVVVIDELADLMMLAPDETEKTICRLAQMARATGIHLIIATQRPSVDVVTGLIKANFPARIAFTVATSIDSRVILDQPGAEKLLGRGDMLFVDPASGAPMRAQGCFLSDKEINKIVRFWRGQYDGATPESLPSANPSLADGAANGGEAAPMQGQITWDEARALDQAAKDAVSSGGDKLFDEAVATVRMHGKASISLLQRRLRIGYTRSARIIEEMEEKGIVGPQTPGSQFREVLPPK